MAEQKQRHGRVIKVLQALLDEHGDMLVSEAIQKLQGPPPHRPVGAPTIWDADAKMMLSLEVLIIVRKEACSEEAALRIYANERGLNARTLEKHYYWGKLLIPVPTDSLNAEQLRELVEELTPLDDKAKP